MRAATVAGVTLCILVAYLIRRRNGRQGQIRPETQISPSFFELIKEQNAHAGRLSVLAGALITVLTFSLTNGPLHDLLFSPSSPALAWIAGCAATAVDALNLILAVLAFLPAIEPAVLKPTASEREWSGLLSTKLSATRAIVAALGSSVAALICAWLTAIMGRRVDEDVVTQILLGILLLITAVLTFSAARAVNAIASHDNHVPRTVPLMDET
jgi:hypothetical protein